MAGSHFRLHERSRPALRNVIPIFQKKQYFDSKLKCNNDARSGTIADENLVVSEQRATVGVTKNKRVLTLHLQPLK